MGKTINFLGMELPVVDEDMIEEQLRKPSEPQYYIVSRVVDTDPLGGSPQLRDRRTRTLCEECGEICWQDPKGYEEVARLHPTIICSRCMIAMVREKKARDPLGRATQIATEHFVKEARNQRD